MGALGKIYNATSIVTMNSNGKINGITVAWITRVSIKPPMIAISIGKERYSHKLLEETDKFGICILSKEQMEIARYFGSRSGEKYNKFENVNYELTENGIPKIKNIVAFFECKIVNKADAGDHTIYIGKVEKEELLKTEIPLLYGEHKLI
ncbi:NADH-FMN oxidoreductase RutF, flavin reductase (DIM6/NTAB) family [Marinitoga hydrogenitolerans DSM 16785]|uniref:NADH-FMN oxidoreductase RutF, flavin reductase (DIM6/NTAB) family n=1 Tax=Marinitoga hydrogenitolerans (strain DSM 16785 / JCM 12826 / AT1271) TaxID=1122195 RepID=A0A1M4SXC6_MARH1|nr:flavin reductase family protein [Marinitoga hydrogenitolerans]SHE36789.1 NADH-FMN oxidoreductase RutF, flavin reductase (DIM6/NTAB) family [Marinitoga hydrogenitolerans DSM 16785]